MRNLIVCTVHQTDIVRVIKSRRFRWAVHVARMEESRSASKILTDKSAGKKPLGRPRHKWEDNIRMSLNINVSIRVIELTQLRIEITGEPL